MNEENRGGKQRLSKWRKQLVRVRKGKTRLDTRLNCTVVCDWPGAVMPDSHKPVAQRHQMVSSSLALLNYCFQICWVLVFLVEAGQLPR